MADFQTEPVESNEPTPREDQLTLSDVALILVMRWRLIVLGSLLIGVTVLGITFLMKPIFTARTSFLPPQQQQSSAASALASLGALSGLASAAGGIKSPADQYVSLMQSVTVADRIIDKFKLLEKFDTPYRLSARKNLEQSVRITAGKKDGLIAVEIDSDDAKLAADMANAYVEELRRFTGMLSLTEAQQRRAFFEAQVKQTQAALLSAQKDLQNSGFNAGAVKAEPKAAAEGYAKLRAELTAAEVRLQALRANLTDGAPEVRRQLELISALRGQVAKTEAPTLATTDSDYIGRYRDYKYQETLFDLFSKQYELARVDESREGALIQVIDPAMPPERKSRPKRAVLAVTWTLVSAAGLSAWAVLSVLWRRKRKSNEGIEHRARLRAEVFSKR